ncbi:hypothetical protein GIKK_60 [Gordonia phage GiKK]|nr:hypothetical protein GIKK_60 [Gordonia phage GiKK]
MSHDEGTAHLGGHTLPDETDLLCFALSAVVQEGSPALIRVAMSALYETKAGRNFLRRYPIDVMTGETASPLAFTPPYM